MKNKKDYSNEEERIWLYNAICTCRNIEMTGLIDGGSNMWEAKRNFYAKLNKDGLIYSESVPDKCHWVRILGFSPAGRQKYLDDKGCIRGEYNLKVQ